MFFGEQSHWWLLPQWLRQSWAPGSLRHCRTSPTCSTVRFTFAGSPLRRGGDIRSRGSYQSNVARPGFEAHERAIVLTEGGRYENLKVQPTGTNNIGRTISFFATYGNGGVQAEETIAFQPGPFFENDNDLTFAALPPGAAEPTPGIDNRGDHSHSRRAYTSAKSQSHAGPAHTRRPQHTAHFSAGPCVGSGSHYRGRRNVDADSSQESLIDSD